MDRFESQITLRERGFDQNTRYTVLTRSASLQKKVMEYHQRESSKAKQKLSCRDKVIKRLLETTGIDVEANAHSDYLFYDEVVEGVKKFLQKKVPTQDSIAKYVFIQSV